MAAVVAFANNFPSMLPQDAAPFSRADCVFVCRYIRAASPSCSQCRFVSGPHALWASVNMAAACAGRTAETEHDRPARAAGRSPAGGRDGIGR